MVIVSLPPTYKHNYHVSNYYCKQLLDIALFKQVYIECRDLYLNYQPGISFIHHPVMVCRDYGVCDDASCISLFSTTTVCIFIFISMEWNGKKTKVVVVVRDEEFLANIDHFTSNLVGGHHFSLLESTPDR